MNALGRFGLAPIADMPGWLSNTIIAAIAGPILMLVFKYTSNQDAIGRVRDSIKANLLALKLFKDSIAVTMQSQGRVFISALLLVFHSIRPVLVMLVPAWPWRLPSRPKRLLPKPMAERAHSTAGGWLGGWTQAGGQATAATESCFAT